jgi:hypothetical protein
MMEKTMKWLKNQKGYTLTGLFLAATTLGTFTFAGIDRLGPTSEAKIAVVDGSKGYFVVQMALAINTLKSIPTQTAFGSEVVAKTSFSGKLFKGAYNAAAGTFTVNTGTALCRPGDGNYMTTGTYVGATGALTFSDTVAC